MENIENLKNISNFCIISHVDHGKSTLADRFLELTDTVAKEKMTAQFLDSMSLEKEKGITIKMHPVRMRYRLDDNDFILNLIDTPGHIDFSYETSRALACVEGAILLVDASKGIQAQTIFNLEQAKKEGIEIVGAVNKIDLPHAQIEQTRKELSAILGVEEKEIFLISAKSGENVKELLEAVIKKTPLVSETSLKPFKGLIFDSKYDSFSGVVAYLRVFQGEIKAGDKIFLMAQGIENEAKEVGFFSPQLEPSQSLKVGEIGYLKTGIKEPGKVRVGDTITKLKIKNEKLKISEIKPLPGYKEVQPVLFMSLYPEEANQFENLERSLEKLKLSDPSLNFQLESKSILGQGFRMGFLGSLQAEIILRRLKEEFNLEVISNLPQVIFKVILKEGKEIDVSSPEKWPDSSKIEEIKEPWARIEIVCPNNYFNYVFSVLKNYQAVLKDTKALSLEKSFFIAEAPLRQVIGGAFYNEIKAKTEGYASFSFKQIGFRQADLVKLDILIGGKKDETFSRIVPKDRVFLEGKNFVKKLKKLLPSQQFSLAIQAAVGGKIIARETKKARRKDVTAPLYGGDVTRKRKLLEIQKKGKEKMKKRANVKIPTEVYLEILRS